MILACFCDQGHLDSGMLLPQANGYGELFAAVAASYEDDHLGRVAGLEACRAIEALCEVGILFLCLIFFCLSSLVHARR